MDFNVGDKVIHRTYGLGEILEVDEKELAGCKQQYYVVQTGDLTVWVPVNNQDSSSLRLPTLKKEFKKVLAILGGPVEPLSFDRFERKTHLLNKMKDGRLESICQVVRDLSFHRAIKKLNDDDLSILERAKKLLLSEWKFALLVPLVQAEKELNELLKQAPADQ